MKKMNFYLGNGGVVPLKNDIDLLRKKWFDFSEGNPNVKVIHAALFMWLIYFNEWFENEIICLPSDYSMSMVRIKQYKTFRKALDQLNDWGFIQIIERAKYQKQADIIKL